MRLTASDAEYYANERQRDEEEIVKMPKAEEAEVADVFKTYSLEDEQITPIVAALRNKPAAWIDFMMRFELGLEKPEPTRARNSGLTIALSYIGGGMVPLLPYMLMKVAREALLVSVAVTLVALFAFGYIKGRFTGKTPIRSAIQTTLVGGLAAGAAFCSSNAGWKPALQRSLHQPGNCSIAVDRMRFASELV